MTFEIITTINNLADYIIKFPGVNTIMTNPIYTALFISIIIVFIIMFIFRNAETDESLFKMGLRGGFYIFLMLIGVIFLHNRVLGSEQITVRAGSDVDRVFRDGGIMNSEDAFVPVDINVDFTQ